MDPNSKKSFFENVTEFEMTNATNSSSQKRMSNHLYWTLRLIISPINYSLKREREHNNWETVLARVSGLRDEIWPRVEDSSPPQLEPPPRDLIAHRLLAFFFFLPFFLFFFFLFLLIRGTRSQRGRTAVHTHTHTREREIGPRGDKAAKGGRAAS